MDQDCFRHIFRQNICFFLFQWSTLMESHRLLLTLVIFSLRPMPECHRLQWSKWFTIINIMVTLIMLQWSIRIIDAYQYYGDAYHVGWEWLIRWQGESLELSLVPGWWLFMSGEVRDGDMVRWSGEMVRWWDGEMVRSEMVKWDGQVIRLDGEM